MFYVLLFLLLLVMALVLTNVKITVIFHRIKEDDHVEIIIALLFGLVKYKFKIPYIDFFLSRMGMGVKKREEFDTGADKELKKKKSILRSGNLKSFYNKIKTFSKKYSKVAKYIVSKMHMDYLKWNTEIGVNDAALTAVLVGIIWSIKCNIISLAKSIMSLEDVDVNVHPYYDRSIFEMDFHCIIRIKIANIIIAGIRILYVLLLHKILYKGGGSNERASYSRVNENYNG